MKPIDARVRYTRMVIQQSFLELLARKPAARITVTEICQQVQINRATFYKHYQDVPALLEAMEEEFFEEIRQQLVDLDSGVDRFLLKLMRLTKSHGERMMALGGDNGDPQLMTKTCGLCWEQLRPRLASEHPEMDESTLAMIYAYVSDGSGSILRRWIQDGMRQPPEQVVALIVSMSEAALRAAGKGKNA